jgi:hypothetical protein
MRTRFDRLAKGILGDALMAAGEVRTQEEIHGEVQATDVWFRPSPASAAARHRLGLLGRIAETSCLLEPFHATPGADAVLDCLNKQLTLRRNLVREARKNRRAPDIPRLWLISVGRPAKVLGGLRFQSLRGWPAGIWQGPPLLHTYVVVLRDLPETRDTLSLRLLGAGRSFWHAVKELHALPKDTWESRVFSPLLLAYSAEIFQNPETASEEDMRDAERLRTIYHDWEERVHQQGLEKGLREALLNAYQVRFGAVPAELHAAIQATTDTGTLRHWLALFVTGSPDAIAAAVHMAPQP